ncbi:ATP-binding protein [Streptomyces similanensis]|uniref:ATP-binding protein n=1 Tax=Streptomyces similanensis TaxID=1274988 RepID=A0ABP9LIV2_9ACTN
MNETLPKLRNMVHWQTLTGADNPSALTVRLRREAASVPICRHLVRQTLTDWNLPQTADTAELVVAELASNTIRHTHHKTFRLTLRRMPGGVIRVTLTDRSRALPAPRDAGVDDLGGRGLALVDVLAQAWGTDRLLWGKRIWADLAGDAP